MSQSSQILLLLLARPRFQVLYVNLINTEPIGLPFYKTLTTPNLSYGWRMVLDAFYPRI
jgi:hypothetical protein